MRCVNIIAKSEKSHAWAILGRFPGFKYVASNLGGSSNSNLELGGV